MRLALRIFDSYRSYTFAVVDLDLSSEYPQNYIAILPRIWYKFTNKNGSPNSKLIEIFGLEEAQKIARELLTKALEEWKNEPKIRAEIEERLKKLEPKPEPEPRTCLNPNCKKTFIPNRNHRYQKFCSVECRAEHRMKVQSEIEEQSEHD